METNVAKSKILCVGAAAAERGRLPKLMGRDLAVVSEFRYLGVELEDRGRWAAAVDAREAATKATTAVLMPLLRNLRLPLRTRITIWHALARSRMEYGAELIAPSSDGLRRLNQCVWQAARAMTGLPKATLLAALEGDLGLMTHQDRADLLALRWRVRLARRDPTDLARTLWTLAADPASAFRSTVTERVDGLVAACGLQAVLDAVDQARASAMTTPTPPPTTTTTTGPLRPPTTGAAGGTPTTAPGTPPDPREAIKKAILKRRADRLGHAPAAAATHHTAYSRVMDRRAVAAGEAPWWLRAPQRSLKPAIFRIMLRARSLPVAEELGRYTYRTAEHILCPFCEPSLDIEDQRHFLLTCPAWATPRAALWAAVETSLTQIEFTDPATQMPALPASAWLASRPEDERLDLLLGAPVPTKETDAAPWTQQQAAAISSALWKALANHGWAMWKARGALAYPSGPRSFPWRSAPGAPPVGRGRGRAGGEAPRPRGRPRGCPRRGLTWRDRRRGDDDDDNDMARRGDDDDDNDMAAETAGPSTAAGPAGRARGRQGAHTRGAPSNRGESADPHSPRRAGSATRGRGVVSLQGADASRGGAGPSAHGGAARGGVATAGSTRGRGALYSRRRGVLPGVPKRAAP